MENYLHVTIRHMDSKTIIIGLDLSEDIGYRKEFIFTRYNDSSLNIFSIITIFNKLSLNLSDPVSSTDAMDY